LNTQSNTQKSF